MTTELLLDDLARLRIAAGEPSYAALAVRTGFARSTLHAALTGARLPSLQLTVAVAAALGADPAEWRRRWVQARSAELRVATGSAGPPATLPAGSARPALQLVERLHEQLLQVAHRRLHLQRDRDR